MLDRPFIIEYLQELRDVVTALGQRMIAAAHAASDDETAPGKPAATS